MWKERRAPVRPLIAENQFSQYKDAPCQRAARVAMDALKACGGVNSKNDSIKAE
jgi:hypothetical protein